MIDIPEAYRIPKNNLNHFMERVREYCLDSTALSFAEIMKHIKIEAFNSWIEENDIVIEHICHLKFLAMNFAFGVFGDSFQSSLNIWIKGKWAFIVPYGIDLVTFNLPGYAKEFSYTDDSKPDHISQHEWDYRRDKWEDVIENFHLNRLNHNMFEYNELVGVVEVSDQLADIFDCDYLRID